MRMRKWFGLALVSCFVVFVTAIYPSQVQRAVAHDYSQRMFHSHQGDVPVATTAIELANQVALQCWTSTTV